MKRYPMALKLTSGSVSRNDSLYRYIASVPGRTGKQTGELVPLFDFKNDERKFAKKLLTDRKNFWLFRCNQQQFCGDFFAIDMSSPDLRKRQAYIMDLKQNADLKTDGGGAGNQFINTEKLQDWIAASFGIIEAGSEVQKVSGDSCLILEWI
jgi:hypothetical protein